LASSSELLAHSRSSGEIAKVIGADGVIYQTLDDLITACAELSPRQPQTFEVGVFCGKYITPVKEDYFEHLDMLRGRRKKEKDLEMARQAVVQGLADNNTVKMAMGTIQNGDAPKEVSSLADKISDVRINTNIANGTKGIEEEKVSPSALQDISLHNLNDYESK
jgi:amidophosphoribosyltransferase